MEGQSKRALLLFAALGVASLAAAQVEVTAPSGPTVIAERNLPLAFSVPEGARLYVHGRRANEVLVEHTDEGAFVLNGTQIHLAPWAWIARSDHRTGDQLARSEASSRRASLIEVAHRAYEEALEARFDIAAASGAAFEAMRAADSDSLVDWEASRGPLGGSIVIRWRERPAVDYDIELVPECVSPDFARTEELDRQYATALWYYLCESPDTCWVFMQEDGTGRAYCGSALVREIEAQLARAYQGREPGNYPLLAREVGAILSAAPASTEE